MLPLVGSVQRYAWGSPTAIPELLGVAGDGGPQAELWFGTHPGAPSRVVVDGGERPLLDVVGTPLPYLVKVLAAAAPLSLQTHPSRAQAEAGFAREEAAGIPRDAPHRTYRDDNHKPEVLCALTPFDALCGLRAPDALGALLDGLACPGLAPLLARLGRPDGLRDAIGWLWRLAPEPAASLVAEVVAACQGRDEPEARWTTRLAAAYPGDVGVVVSLCCNLVTLAPGEAIFLGPGNLHAYLSGVGVEVMAASDNVLRGGLTPKHVDVDALLEVVDFSPLPDPVLRAVDGRYPTPVDDFALERIAPAGGQRAWTAEGPEILVCTEGDVGPLATGAAGYLAPGERVTLAGHGVVFRTSRP
jgi:mannose-6-phosphate isomerase